MEHSKLPWEAMFYDDSVIEIVEVREEESDTIACLSPDTADNLKANAAFIVKACNEHIGLVEELNLHKAALVKFEQLATDELSAYKGKAGLFDELVDALGETLAHIPIAPIEFGSCEEDPDCFHYRIKALLAKAKRVK